MNKRSRRHFVLNHYAFSKHSILQQLQHFLNTINRMSQEVLVPNLLSGKERPGWSNTDLLHMYQVLNQVDHLLRWGNADNPNQPHDTINHQPQTEVKIKLNSNKIDANSGEKCNASDISDILNTLENLSMDELSSTGTGHATTSNGQPLMIKTANQSDSKCKSLIDLEEEEEVQAEPEAEADADEDEEDEEEDEEVDAEDNESNESDAANCDNANCDNTDCDKIMCEMPNVESLLIRCRGYRTDENHNYAACKKCVRILIRYRKRMMKKSARLVRRVVRTHHSTMKKLFSHPKRSAETQSSPLDQHLHDRLQFHLQQLTCILNAFSESAEQITRRYQTLINV